MVMGCPSKYTPEIVEKARYYLENWKLTGDVIPMKGALAMEMGISRDTLNEWAKHEDKGDISDIVNKVSVLQRRELCNRGLDGAHNAMITKLMLCKHGVVEKTESKDQVTTDVTLRWKT